MQLPPDEVWLKLAKSMQDIAQALDSIAYQIEAMRKQMSDDHSTIVTAIKNVP